jgi:Zn-dependent protease
MGWQDRSYSRSSSDNPGGFYNFFFGSFSLGTWFDIHVRVHSSLILLGLFKIIFIDSRRGESFKDALISTILLFVIILLHEFGHCFAARRMGGRADEILLWPLGGLAFVNAPMRPWPRFVTTAGGPLVNVVICLATGIALQVMGRGQFSLPLNPLIPFGGGYNFNFNSIELIYSSTLAYYLFWIYVTSWSLLFFNLLPIYPLDGGSMLQEILWPKFGFYRSMEFACKTGMAGAVVMGLFGLFTGSLWFLVLAYMGFTYCKATLGNLPAMADMAYEENDRYQAYAPRTQRAPRRKRPARPLDDRFTWRDLNPLERMARARRKKQFERLFEDDK